MDKAVAYYRVSTAAQGRSGLGLDAQKVAVKAVAAERYLTMLMEFTEIESGKNNDRPQLQQALKHAQLTGAVLVIAKLDRLSRNAAFLLTLRDSGVKFIAADIPNANDLTIGVLAVIAQAEREAISRRTRESLAVIREKLAAGEAHVSSRSGRTITRLGNPNGAKPLQNTNKGNQAAIDAVRRGAERRRIPLLELLGSLPLSLTSSPTKLAQHLNSMGVLSARGGRWHRSTTETLVRSFQKARHPAVFP